MERPHRRAPRISRRRFLRIAGASGVVALAASAIRWTQSLAGSPAFAAGGRRTAFWSDPNTWGGRVPGRNDFVVVSTAITLDVNARVRGLVVKQQGKLLFHPNRSVTLRSSRNVVVRGRLVIRPTRPGVVHRLLFTEVDERRFVGGGMEVEPSDVGLWVTGNGVLDVVGSPKLAWTRTTGSVPAGATSIILKENPSGWRVGDEVVLTPTLPPSHLNHDTAFDTGIVTAIDQLTRRITLRSPTKFEHPAVDVAPGVILTAEVLNLTRNVRIEGTPSGRSHVWMRSSRRQSIRNACIRYTGPRRPRTNPDLSPSTEPVPGRYGLHFHVMQGASRGTIVTGVVVRDSGSHAFVAHQSHGVTFRDCITHNTFEDAYWWDPSPDPQTLPAPPTDNVLYERCVASMVRSDPPWWGARMAGFVLGARKGNAIRNCVAVGVQGNVEDSSGFIWPEPQGGLWKFEDCLSHNNRMNGIFAWQNNDLLQVITRFTAYHNGRAGIKHGAYANGFLYEDSVLYGNRLASIEAHALSLSSPIQTFSNLLCDQAGLSPYCVVTTPHLAAPGAPVQFVGCRLRGHTKAAFGFVDQESLFPDVFSIVNSTLEGNEFWLGPSIHAGSRIRFLHPTEGILTVRRADQPGEFKPEWNASVTRIS